MHQYLCRRFLKGNGTQTKLEEHMTGCLKQGICKKSYRHPNQKLKLFDWFMKKDLPMQIAGELVCNNIPLNDPGNPNVNNMNIPMVIGFNIIINP